MTKKNNSAEGLDQNDAKTETHVSDRFIDQAHATSETGSVDAPKSPELTHRVGSVEAIHQAKQRALRERKSGPHRPLGQLAHTEAELKNRTRALQILAAPEPKSPDNDLLIYQLGRAVNTGGASSTIAAKIQRDVLSLYASLDSSDPIDSILNRHIVTMSNGAMECQYRSTFAGNPKNFDAYSRHAEKMTQVLIDLIEARERRRRRRPKQVVVGNVNVEAGGQAIVGTVEAREPRPRSDDDPSDDSAAA